jgi:hypothetical protein
MQNPPLPLGRIVHKCRFFYSLVSLITKLFFITAFLMKILVITKILEAYDIMEMINISIPASLSALYGSVCAPATLATTCPV